MQRIALFLCSLLLLGGCGNARKQASLPQRTNYPLRHASLLRIDRQEHFTSVSIINPWDTTQILNRYLLVDRHQALPKDLPQGTLIRTPIERVALFASGHCCILEELHAIDQIVGVCERAYILSDKIQQRLDQGQIADLGEAFAPDIEQIVATAPEVIISSPIEQADQGKLERIGIPIIGGVDYMETTPLGRAEWIRLFGLLMGRESLADSLFEATEERYNAICQLTDTVRHRPTVFTEMKVGSVWYVPGGESFIAHFLRDAGADYRWAEDTHSGSIPLSFEAVFDRCCESDIWLIKYTRKQDYTLATLEEQYAPYRNFAAFKRGAVYGCNTDYTTYYEELPLYPDRVLADLVSIIHPDLLPEHVLRYYKKLPTK